MRTEAQGHRKRSPLPLAIAALLLASILIASAMPDRALAARMPEAQPPIAAGVARDLEQPFAAGLPWREHSPTSESAPPIQVAQDVWRVRPKFGSGGAQGGKKPGGQSAGRQGKNGGPQGKAGGPGQGQGKGGGPQQAGGPGQGPGKGQGKGHGGGGQSAGAVRKFDKNGDGKLSRSEWPKAGIFDFLDADKDGFLTAAEIQSGTKELKKPAEAVAITADDDGPSLTLDEAEKITAETGDQPIAAVPPTVDDITAILDAQKLADPNLAETLRKAATAQPPKGASDAALVEFHRDRGKAAGKIGDTEQERADLEKAIELAERTHSKLLPKLLNELSVVEQRQGRTEAVIALRQRALEIVEGKKAKKAGGLKIKSVSNLVGLYADAGKIGLAKTKMSELEQLLGQTKRFAPADTWRYEWFPRALRAKANLMMAVGRYDKADVLLRAAIKLIDEANKRGLDEEYGASYLDNLRRTLAVTLLHKGRVVEAEIEARRALLETLARVGKYSSETPSNLLTLVIVLREQGRLKEATELAGAAIEIMQTMGLKASSGGMVKAKQVLASSQVQSGDIDAALVIYDGLTQSLGTESETYRRRLLTDSDWMLAMVLAGRQDEAIPVIREALEREKSKKKQSTVRKGVLAMALSRAGKSADARSLFEEVVPKLVEASGTQEDEDYTSGTSKEFRITAILEGYLGLLADLSAQAGGAERQALSAEALKIADAARGRLVQSAVAAASARANVRDPELAELVRQEQDTRKRITAQSGVLAGVLASPLDQQDEEAVAELRETIDTLRAAADELEKEIRSKFPDYALLLNPEAPDLDGLRAALKADEAFVSVYLGRDRTYVWAVPKAGDVAFTTTDLTRDRAEKLVAALRDALNPQAATLGEIPDFDLRLAYRLYEQTLAPAADVWRPAKSLLVAVNGALGQLPLSVLPTEKVRLGDRQGPLFAAYRDVPWLARSHAVTLVPSAAALVTLRSTPEGSADRKPFIGFGDPYFSGDQAAKAKAKLVALADNRSATDTQTFRSRGLPLARRAVPKTEAIETPTLSVLPRLPDTAEEVRSLALAMSADPSQSVRLGLEANESSVKSLKLFDYRVVAFATHGLTPGELSGLVEPALALSAPDASDTDGDGLLTMTEIMGLRLDADWVILSACNTGTGRGAGAEAVSGLGRAFFYAGTRALLVSSWPVETVSARLLTTDLFRRQKQDPGLDRAEALRQAMAALIDRPGMTDEKTNEPVFYYAHPIFWAPFILVGDGGGAKDKS